MFTTIRSLKKSILIVLMAGVMGAGVYAPVMADDKKQLNMNTKESISTFSKKGLRQFKAGIVSGLIKIPLTIFLANKLIIPNKLVALGLTFPVLTLLESFILRKILSEDPKGLPLSSIFTSLTVSFMPLAAYVKNPNIFLGPLSMKIGDELVKAISWIFSGSAPAPVSGASILPTVTAAVPAVVAPAIAAQ